MRHIVILLGVAIALVGWLSASPSTASTVTGPGVAPAVSPPHAASMNPAQLAAARRIAPVVCVQNMYNVAHREDDAFIDSLTQQGIAYVPFFPLGGFNPLQSSALDDIAASINATPMQVALAWLLHRSPNILLIPGTSTRAHLRENLSAASLKLSPEVITKLDALSSVMEWSMPHA